MNILVQCWLSLVYAIPEKQRSVRVLLEQFLAPACYNGQLNKNIPLCDCRFLGLPCSYKNVPQSLVCCLFCILSTTKDE